MLLLALFLAPAANAAPPTVKATWATEVTATSFRARAIFSTANLNSTYRFDYLPLADYETNVKAGQEGFKGASRIPIGSEVKVLGSATDEEVAQRIAGLSADTSYRYRFVAKNSSGEAIGPERTVTTQESTPSFVLAEGRGWELVSPVDKNGGEIGSPEGLLGGGAFQAASQGGVVTYGSASSFAGANGAPGASQYLSTRASGGWSTTNITLPTEAGAFGPEPDGVPYRLFSGDLTFALALTQPHAFELLATTPALAGIDKIVTADLRFSGATPNFSHLTLATCQALTADATEVPNGGGGCDPAFPNLYMGGEGELRLVNLEPGDSTGTPGAELAAQGVNAISTDGARVYWVDKDGALMLRDGTRTLEVDGEGEFQAASSDGSFAYFTKAAHLYRYTLASESSTDLTPGGEVAGMLGASADGSYAYYLDAGGVKLWHQGTTSPVASDADPSSYPPATGTARVSASGTRLAFLASADLTGYESLGATELFLYQADAGNLLCASCNPTGARPLGLTTIPGAISNGEEVQAYKPRVMDAAGTRLFFDTEDAISPKDANGEPDVYEWRAQGVGGCAKAIGCIGLISSGRGADGSTFVDASADGIDAFFLAGDSLVTTDPGSVDLYDARIGGGFPAPPKPIPCFGDACQPLPPEPDDPTPGTLFYGSEANPKLRLEVQGKKGKGNKGKGRKGKGNHRRKHQQNKTGGKGK